MNFNKFFLFIVIIFLAISSCSKSSSSSSTSPVTPPVTTSVADIYILGTTSTGNVYFKNGIATALTGFEGYSCTGIAVSGSDVYVSGYIKNVNGNNVAAYWKNGKVNTLSDGTQSVKATGIAISGSNVYVSGYASYTPILINGNYVSLTGYYWKNGVVTTLTGSNTIGFGIAVNGNDVYVTGSVNLFAAYWKNNSFTELSDGLEHAAASVIQVTNGNVYTGGWIDYSASSAASYSCYWKNSTKVAVSDPQSEPITGIAVSSDNIYTSGYHTAVYWKNGTAVALSSPPASPTSWSISGIAVNGSDVYVSESSGYWKNGTFTTLTDCKSTIAIVAVPQK